VDLKLAKLWPSLAHIRSEFYPEQTAGMQDPVGRSGNTPSSKTSPQQRLEPLLDLQRRRHAVAAKRFSSAWSPGKFVLINVFASARPVLLTRSLGADLWSGFLVAPECDWASAFDVLLEPTDEPFDPLCGMVQCWNPITINARSHQNAQTLGELSNARLQTMLTAASEATKSYSKFDRSSPGFIGLRSLSNGETVLTGGGLEDNDMRIEFQTLYRGLGKAISV
jgi:hypothetical protein